MLAAKRFFGADPQLESSSFPDHRKQQPRSGRMERQRDRPAIHQPGFRSLRSGAGIYRVSREAGPGKAQPESVAGRDRDADRPHADAERPRAGALLYAAVFAGIGVAMPFLPLWLAGLGLGPELIGALVAGIDALRSEHRERNSRYDMMSERYTDTDAFPWSKDALMHNYGAFAEATWSLAERDRLVSGARVDRASAKDYRQSFRSMMGMTRPNPTAGETRAETLPSGFVRYEHDLSGSPTTLYAGLGHVQRFPDYWELFSANMGPISGT